MLRSLLKLLPLWLGLATTACAQTPPAEARVQAPAFQEKLTGLLRFDVPVITVQEAHARADEFVFLDTREPGEYNVSHLPGARLLGYDRPDFDQLDDLEKDTPIVLYCSVGYRSERIGRRLRKRGFTQVQNLYGSIFEWMNAGYPVEGPDGRPTQRVHTYNKKWSQWVDDDAAEKVW